jgi:hypothetical protein
MRTASALNRGIFSFVVYAIFIPYIKGVMQRY